MNVKPFDLIDQSLIPEEGFDYTSLNPKSRSVVQQYANEIKSLIRRTTQDIIDIGQKLIEAKEQLGHGQFEDWLKTEFNWGQWTARKFMQVARRFKTVNFTDMSIDASALYLLAAPSTPEMVRQEAIERARQGELITNSKVKAISNRYKKVDFDAPVPFTVNVSAKSLERELLCPTSFNPEIETIEARAEKNLEDPAYLLIDNYSLSPREQKEVQQLFRAGNLLCINDLKQEGSKWFGHVSEVKEVSANEVEIIIRVSLQP